MWSSPRAWLAFCAAALGDALGAFTGREGTKRTMEWLGLTEDCSVDAPVLEEPEGANDSER
eukprot:3518225-Alexandrium_andersonii.AAC.1